MFVNIDLTTNAGIHELCYLVAQEIYDALRCEFLDFSNSRSSTIKELTWTMVSPFPEYANDMLQYYKIVMDNLSTLSFYLGSFTKSLDIWVILSDGSFISNSTIWIELVSWTTHRKHISMANGINGDFTAQWRELQDWSISTGEGDMEVFNRFVYNYKTPPKEPEIELPPIEQRIPPPLKRNLAHVAASV